MTLPIYLSVPGAKPIGDLHERILEKEYDGPRVDIPDEHVAATDVLRELVLRKAIVLIAGGKMQRQHPREGPAWKPGELIAHVNDTCEKMRDLGLFASDHIAIEIGNEPDLAAPFWKKNPAELARTFRRCFDVIREYSATVPVLCPSVSNLNARGFAYLEAMVREGLPLDCDIAVHRYPHGPSVEIAHEGFMYRGDEIRKLLTLSGGRRIWITETGMREGPHGRGDGLYLSEDEVADQFEREVLLWASVPQVAGICWYAINDGPDRKNELHTYGVRRMDGTWKPVAERVAVVKRKLKAHA